MSMSQQQQQQQQQQQHGYGKVDSTYDESSSNEIAMPGILSMHTTTNNNNNSNSSSSSSNQDNMNADHATLDVYPEEKGR